tara:strand:- start:44 stop:229 length:186 start_codon:yes stop_codon:yes gene_type:complete
MKLRTKTTGQKPFVSEACRGTEIAITSIFSRAKSTLIGGGEAAGVPAIGAAGMRFSLGQVA